MAKKPFSLHIDPSMFEPARPGGEKGTYHTKAKPVLLAGMHGGGSGKIRQP